MKNNLSIVLLILLGACFSKTIAQKYEGQTVSFGNAQTEKTTTRILFIYDDSFSMFGKWKSGSKTEISKKLMGEFLDSIKNTSNLQIALRCYGHQSFFQERNCKDTKLEVPFADVKTNAPKIKDRINKLEPTGTTPIAYSLGQCAADFTPCENCKNVVILITDGIEECGGDPCAISLELQKKGIFLRPFVIGVGLNVKFADVFGCMGKFYDVSNEATFKSVLKLIMLEALTQTTAQVNLNSITGKPIETDVTMTFYDMATGKMKYNYLHTLNHRGNPDTLILDPDLKYKIIVHTIPQVIKENVAIERGKHNIIPIDAPQGSLVVNMEGANLYKNLVYLVRKKDVMNTLNVQELSKPERYIVGKYDIEILTLPRILKEDIEIKQSFTNTIKIPGPGTLILKKSVEGYGSIYTDDGKTLTLVYNMNYLQNLEYIYLQPGKYKAEFRFKNNLEAESTVEKSFTVETGKSVTLNF